MIKVLIMNGAFGFKFRYKDTIHAAVKEVFQRVELSASAILWLQGSHKVKFKFSGSKRGSIFRSSQRYCERWIKKNSNKDDVLLLIGKSAGAYRLIQAINETMPSERYKTVYLLTVDINFHANGGKNMNNTVISHDDHDINEWINIYQIGEIGGYIARKASDINSDNVCLKEADHFDITTNRMTRDYIKWLLECAIEEDLR